MMTADQYRKTMIDILKLQQTYFENDWDDGIWKGLQIAIEKLKGSDFLTKEEEFEWTM